MNPAIPRARSWLAVVADLVQQAGIHITTLDLRKRTNAEVLAAEKWAQWVVYGKDDPDAAPVPKPEWLG